MSTHPSTRTAAGASAAALLKREGDLVAELGRQLEPHGRVGPVEHGARGLELA